MSPNYYGVGQSKVAYVIFILVGTVLVCVESFPQNIEDNEALLSQNRVRRQQLPFPFPLDQIFQLNAAELGSATQVDVENDFSFIPNLGGNGVTDAQVGNADAGVQREPSQRQLSQVFNSLIEAAAVQQSPTPQVLARTVMNSGLR